MDNVRTPRLTAHLHPNFGGGAGALLLVTMMTLWSCSDPQTSSQPIEGDAEQQDIAPGGDGGGGDGGGGDDVLATADGLSMDSVAGDASVADTLAGDVVPTPIAIGCPLVPIGKPPAALNLDAHYARYVDVGGIALISSSKVGDSALRRAAWILAKMLHKRPCTQQALARSGVRFGVIGTTEKPTQMPEYSDLNTAFPSVDWDKRGRGYGATWMRPLTTGADENLTQSLPDKAHGEVIFLHESAHALWAFGVRDLASGGKAQQALVAAYKAALAKGLWAKTYAATNEREYWAEGVQSWFGDNKQADPPNNVHNHVNTRAELKAYDPGLAALLAAQFDDGDWSVQCSLAKASKPAAWPILPAPETATCSYEITTNTDLGCKNEPALGKAPSTDKTQLLLANRRFNGSLLVHRLTPEGKRTLLTQIKARGQKTLSVNVGRRLVLTTNDGGCLKIIEISPGANRAAVDPG
ncbi:MAG: hypothetical protein KC502_17855 [Myxococcales bacterium]|nr:hypothetical protein [Myxococcales bacterium]